MERSRGRKWSALHWAHCRYATCYASERHGQPTAAGWVNWYSKEKRVAQESKCRVWGCGPRDGYASSMRRDAGGGGMVQWHAISYPRAHWKPSGSSWSLGQATCRCAGMATDVEAQHRHRQPGRGVHHQWLSRMQRRLTRGNSKVDADSRSRCVKEGNSKLCLESGQPFSGAVRGSEQKSVNSAVVRPRIAR